MIALALVLSITPGVVEVVESVAHLVAHLDLPHHEDGALDEGECGEHTCTPLAHHCGCHSGMTAQLSYRKVDVGPLDTVGSVNPNAIARAIGRAFDPPPLRPPIS